MFEELKEPVEVLFFGKSTDCDYCEDTMQLIQEVTALSDTLSLSVYDIEEHANLADQYHVDKVPALVLAGREGDQILDYGVRFAGIPSGHEFSSLINDLILVSGRDSRTEPRDASIPGFPGKAGASDGVRHTHLTLLPTSRGARSPIGRGKPYG